MTIDCKLLFRNIGSRIREARRSLDLTQDQLSNKVGVQRTSITNLEKGQQNVSLMLLYDICDALALQISDILPAISEVKNENNVAKKVPVDQLLKSIAVNGPVQEVTLETAELIRRLAKKGDAHE